jgi:hypothetical protein
MSIYLYKKTHNKTGIMYLGKTEKDPFKYKGSGKKWKHHIKKHGYDVTTEILGIFESIEDFRTAAIKFSEEQNIVSSSKWANLRPEKGDGGDTSKFIDYSLLNRGRGLTYEERYGKEKATELKKLRSLTLGKNSSSRKGKTLVELYGKDRAKEITEANSLKHKGKRFSLSEDTKLKISNARIGYKCPRVCCLICHKEIGINNLTQHQSTHSKQEIL